MITLVASTITLLAAAVQYERYMMVVSDSTTLTRLATTKVGLETSSTGVVVTAYYPLVICVKPGQQLYAVSTGTPNLGIQPVKKETAMNVVEVY